MKQTLNNQEAPLSTTKSAQKPLNEIHEQFIFCQNLIFLTRVNMYEKLIKYYVSIITMVGCAPGPRTTDGALFWRGRYWLRHCRSAHIRNKKRDWQIWSRSFKNRVQVWDKKCRLMCRVAWGVCGACGVLWLHRRNYGGGLYYYELFTLGYVDSYCVPKSIVTMQVMLY